MGALPLSTSGKEGPSGPVEDNLEREPLGEARLHRATSSSTLEERFGFGGKSRWQGEADEETPDPSNSTPGHLFLDAESGALEVPAVIPIVVIMQVTVAAARRSVGEKESPLPSLSTGASVCTTSPEG